MARRSTRRRFFQNAAAATAASSVAGSSGLAAGNTGAEVYTRLGIRPIINGVGTVTNLGGCLKTYVPWSTGRFGLVFVPVAHPTRPLALRAFAFGVRHPTGSRPSVYRVAHGRRNAA